MRCQDLHPLVRVFSPRWSCFTIRIFSQGPDSLSIPNQLQEEVHHAQFHDGTYHMARTYLQRPAHRQAYVEPIDDSDLDDVPDLVSISMCFPLSCRCCMMIIFQQGPDSPTIPNQLLEEGAYHMACTYLQGSVQLQTDVASISMCSLFSCGC